MQRARDQGAPVDRNHRHRRSVAVRRGGSRRLGLHRLTDPGDLAHRDSFHRNAQLVVDVRSTVHELARQTAHLPLNVSTTGDCDALVVRAAVVQHLEEQVDDVCARLQARLGKR